MQLFYDAQPQQGIIAYCLRFLSEKMPGVGKYELTNGIFCTVSTYQTIPCAEGIWEAHKKYADLHCVLHGAEQIQVGSAATMKTLNFDAEKDFLQLSGEAAAQIKLRPGWALCLLPDDAHMVKIHPDEEAVTVTKAVFKIPIELL